MSGVGKTYAMVDEGLRRASRGTDVVIGVIDDDRPGWKGRVIPLEHVALTAGAGGERELDVDRILERHPDVVLVDDIGHQLDDGHGRWEAADQLLAAGIDVIGTLDIGDLA